MAVTAKELIFKIIGDSEQFNKSVSETTKKLDDFKKKTKDANELFGQVSKQAAIATTAIAAMGIAAAKMAVDFNAGFAKVQTLIPGAKERVKEFQKEILNLSPAVGKTTKDLTDGLYEVISAFGDSADSAKNLELAAKGATAGGATTKDAIALLSAVTKGYGDTSNAAQKKVSDLAFTTVKLGQTSFPELAASIQRVTSQSNTLKISQEELFAVFSSGTGVIGGAAEVSTKFSALLTEMQKPGDILAKTFKALGAESGTGLIEKFGGLQGALQALKAEAEKTGEPISNLFGSAEAGKLALYAAGEGAAKFTSDLNAMNQAAGATEQAFKDATNEGPDAFGFQLRQAGLNAQAFAIKVGQELIPSLQELLNPLFKGAEYLKNLDSQTIKTITGVGKILITLTSVTAGVYGFIRATRAAREAMLVLNGAFKASPIGLFIVGVTTAIVAMKELCEWSERLANAEQRKKIEEIKNNAVIAENTKNITSLANSYIELAEKENLSASEKTKLKHDTESLIKLYPELKDKLSLEESGYKNNIKILKDYSTSKRKELEERIIKSKKEQEIRRQKIQDKENEVEKLKSLNQQMVKARGKKGAKRQRRYSENNTGIRKKIKEIKDLNEQIEVENHVIKQLEAAIASLEDTQKGLAVKESTGGKSPYEIELEALQKAQKDRLKTLDESYIREKQIIEKRNIDALQKNEELKTAEQKYYGERTALLETFHNENLEKGLSYAQSELRIVGSNGENIKAETEKTNKELSRIADEKHKKEIEEINGTFEKTKKAVEDEIALKKELGQIEGNSEKEKERNIHLAKSQSYLEKQNELMEEYLRLINSSNEKDREKAEAIKKQAEALGNAATKEAKKAANAVEESAKKAAEAIQAIGSVIEQTLSAVSAAANAAINNKEAERKRKTALELAEIEREKNQTLLEIDNELSERREQKQIEDAEREEQRRNEEHEKRLAEYNRNLLELQGQFEAETNIEKLKYLEKQLEAEKKKKAEETARKKQEDEKRKRDKEARLYEISLLNAKSQAEHEFAVARVQTENAAGDAAAKAAQQAAKWQKAQGVISMTIKGAEQTALAAIAIAKAIGGDLSGALEAPARIAAAGAAVVQAGIIAGQPSPPDYIQQPLPPAPRPIKFAQGGIVMPSNTGTGITLPNGNAGLVAEAGLPELILPITPPNLQNVFKAANIKGGGEQSSASISYSPSYSISISQNADEDLGDKIIGILREHDREALNIIESGRQKYFLGD